MAYETILVPVDFAGCAHDVVEHAARFSAAFHARVVLLYAVELPEGVHPSDALDNGYAEDKLDQEARTELDALRGAFDPSTSVKVRLSHGAPVECILNAIAEHGASLVVMGTHGRTGLRRLVFGSVAEEVIRNSSVPVVVVHAGAAIDQPSAAWQRARQETMG